MNKKKAIFLAIVLCLLTFLAVYYNTRPEPVKKVFEISNTIKVVNLSNRPYIDTLVAVTLQEIFQLDTVKVTIFDMKQYLDSEEYIISGYITKDHYNPHSYYIFINPERLMVSVYAFLSHELLHLQQMEEGRLVPLDNWGQVYRGDTIAYALVPYGKRMSEIETFMSEGRIERRLKQLIYE